jgi:hypothetical protein
MDYNSTSGYGQIYFDRKELSKDWFSGVFQETNFPFIEIVRNCVFKHFLTISIKGEIISDEIPPANAAIPAVQSCRAVRGDRG